MTAINREMEGKAKTRAGEQRKNQERKWLREGEKDEWLKEKIFECSLKVLNECFGVYCQPIWKGQGLSKSKAKMSSFKELMDKLKEIN